jgi:hypothetical protein
MTAAAGLGFQDCVFKILKYAKKKLKFSPGGENPHLNFIDKSGALVL